MSNQKNHSQNIQKVTKATDIDISGIPLIND